MISWQSLLLDHIKIAVKGDPFWESRINREVLNELAPCGIHLAILVEPYLQFILEGKKTVESRFTSRDCAPYRSVFKDDIILLKRSGGPIVGVCQLGEVWFYQLNSESRKFIKNEFTEALCAQDPSFWEERESATFATLMRVKHVKPVKPIKCDKRDRRGWVVLRNPLGPISCEV